MQTVSMKREKKSKSEMNKATVCSMEEPQFPYGLRIRLEKEDLEKLGIKNIPQVGTAVPVYAKTVVIAVSESAAQGGEDYCSVELQITDLALETKPSDEAVAKKIYPTGEGK